jgi:tetratricopeptide (TPR) repeat protein
VLKTQRRVSKARLCKKFNVLAFSPLGKAKALYHVASAYLDLPEFEPGVESVKQALAIYREVGDRPWRRAIAWAFRGGTSQAESVCTRLGNLTAFGSNSHSKTLLQPNSYSNSFIKDYYLLAWIGEAHRQLKSPEKASEFLEQALTVSRAINNQSVQAMTQLLIGLLANDRSQPEKALEAFQQALTVFNQTGDRLSSGNTLWWIGLIYQNQKQYDQSIEFYQQALAIYKELGDRTQEGNTLDNIAEVYERLGKL